MSNRRTGELFRKARSCLDLDLFVLLLIGAIEVIELPPVELVLLLFDVRTQSVERRLAVDEEPICH